MLTYENRCPICGENRLENVKIKGGVAHCQICSCRYQLEEEIIDASA